MTSPVRLDPYETLGVAKDADVATIRIAHRKLALKHHPDRIRDEAEREKGKNEFQKIQEAYEILTDPARRGRYDEGVKLAELRRERMMRQASQPPVSTPSHPPPRDRGSGGMYYDYVERSSPTTYFDRDHRDHRDHYDDSIPRTTSRKSDLYEKRSTPPKSSERREKGSSRWNGPVEGVSFKVASQMKAKAADAKMKSKERDSQRQKAEVRDREKRRERSEKQSSRRSAIVDSASDDDDIISRNIPKPSARATEPDTEHVRPRLPPRKPMYADEDSEYEKWERHHQNSRDYIAESQRPNLSRSESNAYVYWEGDSRGGRRSGSDSERRSKPRRSAADDARPRPAMPGHTSAPSGLRKHVDAWDSQPQRAKTSTYPTDRERESRREPPGLNRAATMPVRPKEKGTNAPTRGSSLKNSETLDSGYYSTSNPHTPEMRGDSPPRDIPKRNGMSTKYTIVDAADSDEETVVRAPRVNRTRIISSDDDTRRVQRSPERISRDRDIDRDRPKERPTRPRLDRLDTDNVRTRSSRGPTSVPRTEYAHYESQSPREMHSVPRSKLFGEVDEPDAPPSSYTRPAPSKVKTTSYRTPVYATHRNRSPEYDYPPDARFTESSNYPTSRRPSAAY